MIINVIITTSIRVEKRKLSLVGEGSDGLECVTKFCYLDDMTDTGGGAENALRTGIRCAWGKFNKLKPFLVLRGTSQKLKGKINRACVQSVLVYRSEAWPMKIEDAKRLLHTERAMVRRMCGGTLSCRKRSEDLISCYWVCDKSGGEKYIWSGLDTWSIWRVMSGQLPAEKLRWNVERVAEEGEERPDRNVWMRIWKCEGWNQRWHKILPSGGGAFMKPIQPLQAGKNGR